MFERQLTAALLLCAVALPASARNTADDWKWASDYYKAYGEWTTACETRSDDATIKRCYLRYVDAYARDPFGALFVFGTSTQAQGLRFEFEYEGGTAFTKAWMVVDATGAEIWRFDPNLCLTANACVMIGDTAEKLRHAMSADTALNMDLRDRVGRTFQLSWPATGFAEALDDLIRQSADRAL